MIREIEKSTPSSTSLTAGPTAEAVALGQSVGHGSMRRALLTSSEFERMISRGLDHFANQTLSAMRRQFGGHAEKPAG